MIKIFYPFSMAINNGTECLLQEDKPLENYSIELMMLRTIKFLICIGFLINVLYKYGDNKRNPQYKSEFTERPNPGKVMHPGNAWSSVIYTALGIYLITTPAILRPWSRTSEGVTLIWFSWLSFNYHATESDWIGAMDITMVTHLCISCLAHSLDITDLKCMLIAWSITISFLANVIYQRYNVANAIIVKFMIPIVTTLVVPLLWFQFGVSYWRFFTFGTGFLLKLIDRKLAKYRIPLGIVNGTSVFHILTGMAMFMHYEVML